MPSCPNCASEVRDGARFCTKCGYQYPETDEAAAWSDAAATHLGFQAWGANYPDSDADAAHEGWPAASVVGESAAAWGSQPAASVPTEPGEPSPEVGEGTEFWPEPSPDAWATAASSGGAAEVENQGSIEKLEAQAPAPVAEPGSENQVAQARALELLDQLRTVIDSIGPIGSLDLRGVVSDLEVAATPPGAVPADDLAALREAIFAARENPRDIDTIVDLTRRIDGLAALVIAYDRAIAAIERSLDALKRAEEPRGIQAVSPPGSDDTSE